MGDDQPDVDDAYALETDEDRRKLYAAWAATYDDDFAAATDYIYPQEVARVFHARGGRGPVLDAGAGTGLVAQAIAEVQKVTIDAFDLSAEMLDVARQKALYRALFQGDLTQRLPFDDASYGAVVSAGTFTHGHVGSEAFDELMRVARPGALFVLTIKAELFDKMGFAEKLAGFGDDIRDLTVEKVAIYGAQAASENTHNRGLVASFFRA